MTKEAAFDKILAAHEEYEQDSGLAEHSGPESRFFHAVQKIVTDWVFIDRAPAPVRGGEETPDPLILPPREGGREVPGARLMVEIGKLLLTQDNAITAEPIFYVEALRREFHIVASEATGSCWLDDDGGAPDDPQELEEIYKATGREKILSYRRASYVDRWERVTACFTRAAAEEFIRVDGHNHRHYGVAPRIYVGTGYRNAEWIAVRRFLMELAGGEVA